MNIWQTRIYFDIDTYWIHTGDMQNKLASNFKFIWPSEKDEYGLNFLKKYYIDTTQELLLHTAKTTN